MAVGDLVAAGHIARDHGFRNVLRYLPVLRLAVFVFVLLVVIVDLVLRAGAHFQAVELDRDVHVGGRTDLELVALRQLLFRELPERLRLVGETRPARRGDIHLVAADIQCRWNGLVELSSSLREAESLAGRRGSGQREAEDDAQRDAFRHDETPLVFEGGDAIAICATPPRPPPPHRPPARGRSTPLARSASSSTWPG